MGELSVDLSAKMEVLKTKSHSNKTGISFPRYFTARLEAGKTPYDEVQWETRTASIGNDKGSVIFEQRDVEVPVGLVADRHQHRRQQVLPRQAGLAERETSVAQLVRARGRHHRRMGREGRLLRRPTHDGENFRIELAHLMLTQKACFNSPVWFNVGVKETRGYGWIYDKAADRVDQARIRRHCARSARPASSSR